MENKNLENKLKKENCTFENILGGLTAGLGATATIGLTTLAATATYNCFKNDLPDAGIAFGMMTLMSGLSNFVFDYIGYEMYKKITEPDY